MSANHTSPWRDLPRYTRQQVALHQTAVTYLTQEFAALDFSSRLAEHLGQVLRAKALLGSPDIRVLARGELEQLLPDTGYFAVVGAQPTPAKILVDIDASLGSYVVDRLLAGDGAQGGSVVAREPTDLELGVVTFVLLDVLSMLTGELNGGRELALTVDRMLGKSHAVLPSLLGSATGTEQVDGSGNLLQLGFRLQLERKLGYVRILLPEALVTGFFGEALRGHTERKEELTRVRRCLAALPDHSCQASVTAAKLTLSADDMANVEAGDIIVLEDHKLELTPTALSGTVMVRIGAGQNGGFIARLFDEMGESKLEVTDIVVQHDVQGATMADAEQAAPDNLPETEGLLRDVDASVAVELGRLRLSTAQVVRLRKGQILRLARAANDPVDLVVGGKLFARGELLEVDGELGVRLTHVTGADS